MWLLVSKNLGIYFFHLPLQHPLLFRERVPQNVQTLLVGFAAIQPQEQ